MSDKAMSRPRTPPRERFAGAEHVIDLEQAFADLPAESTWRQGHIQKAVYRHGRFTMGIFQFRPGGQIDQHTVDGEAIIHVLAGRLSVQTSQAEYDLRAGQMLMLDPGVPHDFKTAEPTRMVLTVVLGERDGAGE